MPLRQVWQKVPEQIRYTARPETRELQNTQSAWTSEQWNLKNWQNLPKKKRSIFASSEWMIRLSESCGRIGRCGNPYVRSKEKRRYFGRIKAFKRSYEKYDIPTAGYENFTDPKEAIAYLENAKFPIVLKADGLALGKGVLICQNFEEAKEGVKTIMLDKKFGTAGNEMVIEEFMTGREVSVLSFVDGKTIKTMTSAQDHKRAGDGDTGLNTGGMGTFSPSPFYTKEVEEFCEKYIYQRTVDAMAAEGRPFKGVIFFGLMLTEEGPKVLEYNARFGDPEAQVVLPRMKNDILDVVEACVDGTLDQIDLQFEDNAAVCVVLASEGYPVQYEKGYPITGLEEFSKHEGYYCFHAGTKFEDGNIVTNGGRVLGVTAKGANLKEARKNAYAATEWVQFKNKYKRNDIGKAIDEAFSDGQ